MYGVEKCIKKEQNLIALLMLLSNIKIEDFNEEAARCYGFVTSILETKGKVIGQYGMLIAGQALTLNCALVINNEKEYKLIKKINIENWS